MDFNIILDPLVHSPNTETRNEILIHKFLGDGKKMIFLTGQNQNPNSKIVGGVQYFNFGPFRACLGPQPQNRNPNQKSVR